MIYKFPEGKNLADNEKAILKNDPGHLTKQMALIEFDGIRNKVKNWNRYGNKMNGNYQIEMLPGLHTAVVTMAGSIGKPVKIEFMAEAGKTYYLKQEVTQIRNSTKTSGSIIFKDYNVRVWIEE